MEAIPVSHTINHTPHWISHAGLRYGINWVDPLIGGVNWAPYQSATSADRKQSAGTDDSYLHICLTDDLGYVIL